LKILRKKWPNLSQLENDFDDLSGDFGSNQKAPTRKALFGLIGRRVAAVGNFLILADICWTVSMASPSSSRLKGSLDSFFLFDQLEEPLKFSHFVFKTRIYKKGSNVVD
jgi:hypothetical protein